jgi:hypothetical protein
VAITTEPTVPMHNEEHRGFGLPKPQECRRQATRARQCLQPERHRAKEGDIGKMPNPQRCLILSERGSGAGQHKRGPSTTERNAPFNCRASADLGLS